MEIYKNKKDLQNSVVFSPTAPTLIEKREQGDEAPDLVILDTPVKAAGKGTRKAGRELPESLRRLIPAADAAPLFMITGNMPSDFHLTKRSEVDPGSFASEGVDARGNRIWVVDQKIRFDQAPPEAVGTFLDGFFCGKAHGPHMNGPRMKIVALEREGVWEEVPQKDNSDRASLKSPFADPTISRFIAQVCDVHPITNKVGELLPGASFFGVVDKRQTIRGPDHSEFTFHFLNPDKTRGPFPGTTDGAVRFRALRNSDGGATIEGYYVTREATQYLDEITDFVPGMKTGKTLFSLGHSLYKLSPMGLFTGGLTDRIMGAAEGLADTAIGSTGAVRKAISAFHARFYRTVMFPNLIGLSSTANE